MKAAIIPGEAWQNRGQGRRFTEPVLLRRLVTPRSPGLRETSLFQPGLSFLLLLSVFFTTTHFAQLSVAESGEWLIKTWETQDGLPENSATAMVQTADGYLWFGTFNGLVRFDGVRFTVLNPSNTPGLPSAAIVNLHLNRTGKLWVSTYEGMAVLANNQWRTVGKEDGWDGDFVRTFTERQNGDFLVTTFNGMVIECHQGKYRTLPHPPGELGKGYFGHVDEAGNWWVIQNKFIGKWDGKHWVSTLPPPDLPAESLGSGRARDGGLWLLLGKQLRKYSEGREIARIDLARPPGAIWSLTEDRRGNLWICTSNNGLILIRPNGHQDVFGTSDESSHHGVRFAFEDREGTMWVGANGNGLMRFKKPYFRSYGKTRGLSPRVVNSVWPDSTNGVLAATYGGGIFRIRGKEVTPMRFPGTESSEAFAQSVLTDRAGRTWMGTYASGLWCADHHGTRNFSSDQTGGGNVVSLFEDSRGRIWIGGGQSVSVFEGEEFRPLGPDQSLPTGAVRCFAEDAKGVIWLAHDRGVFTFQNNRFDALLPGNTNLGGITCLKPDSDGTMWMGSREGKLLRLREGELAFLDARSGFPGHGVYGILEDDHGAFWMPSGRGIIRALRSDLNAAFDGTTTPLSHQVFDVSDGLPSVECANGRQPVCAQDAAGRLWFATAKGVAVVDPAELPLNRIRPPTYIEELTYFRHAASNGKDGAQKTGGTETQTRLTAPFSEPLTLSAGSRRIEVRYTGVSLVAPEKMRFQVKLENHDETWQDAGNRRMAYYHELPPGEYVFRVRAANNDGVWNETGASLSFRVLPSFWQTAWFKSLAWIGVGVEGVLILALLANIRRLRRAQSDLVESKDQMTLAAESAQLGMWSWDVSGNVVWATDKLLEIFGFTREQKITSRSFLESVHPENRAEIHQAINAALQQGTCYEKEYQIMWSDGTTRWIAARGQVERNARGKPLRMLGVATDITERRQAEMELHRHRTELAHVSRLSVMGELSASMAHELNQPLTAILANAQAAQRFMAAGEANLEEFREISKDIVQDTNRARDVIRHLRTLVRKGEVEYSRLNLNEVVEQVVGFLHGDIVGRNVTVRTELSPHLPAVRGDRTQVQQVLLNLLMNAFDALTYNPQPERCVTIITAPDSSKAVRLAVRDQGMGLAPGQIEKLFQSFYTTKANGLGIGLSVSRSIVDAHGGRLWAENNEGRGATFSLTLPVFHENGETDLESSVRDAAELSHSPKTSF